MTRLALLALLSAAGPLAAEPFLGFPVACTLGQTCFIEDYVDTAPEPGKARDFTCGLNTRDNHRGTDIALPDPAALEAGVAVLAAAPGIVLRTRDSMPDDPAMPGVTDQNACGNAVLIEHENGYDTLYCHLRQGSVRVAQGAPVALGDRLGSVGLSGQTNHPHLHFTVLRDGKTVDPFRPEASDSCNPDSGETLWIAPPPYHATLLRLAGFSDAVPDHSALRSGTARRDRIAPDQALVVYAEAGFAEHGDVVTITAFGPQGEIFRHSRIMKAPKVSQLPAFGKRAPPGGWPPGRYRGRITLTRGDTLVANRWTHVTVE